MKKILIVILVGCAIACMGAQGKTASGVPGQKITVRLNVPDPGWGVTILEVHRVGSELWVVSELKRPQGKFPQVISIAEDSVDVPAASLPVVHFITGKTWNWSGPDSIRFIDSKEEIAATLYQGECLYRKGDAK